MRAFSALRIISVMLQPETGQWCSLRLAFHTHPPRTLFYSSMSDELSQQTGESGRQAEKPAPRLVKRRAFRLPDGRTFSHSEWKSVSKFDRDVLVHHYGEEKHVVPAAGKKKEKVEWITDYDPDRPLHGGPLVPGLHSPICKQCGLHENGCSHPFMAYSGPDRPLVTIIFDGVTRPEDTQGCLGRHGSPASLSKIIREHEHETGVSLDDVRWVPMTRCANWVNKLVNLKPRGNWCRYHVIDDLMRHPPALVMPVGTTALGLLSHKSNAQEWTGRLLTFRGWPDDWLTNPKYALPRPDPRGVEVTGHPVFGPVPDVRLPMVPVQAPRLVFAAQNQIVTARWTKSIVQALKMAKDGVKARSYTRDWYLWTEDVSVIEQTLTGLLQHPGIELTYDTETTGLRGWAADAAIVSIMFRWVDPADGQPRSIGFPWDFEGSTLRPHIPKLKLLVWKVLTQSKLIGHNLTFDMLYTFATFWRTKLTKRDDPDYNRRRDRWITKLADACRCDTWHMAFALQQRRGSLGLEALAYDWVPDLAGYEEDMTLLIDLHYDTMHPAAGKGGHYLNCPKDKWPSHLVSYVMGDVEVCHQAHAKISQKLAVSNLYEFPLAMPGKPGQFRDYTAPGRDWVYKEIMSPAASVLMKMMARGIYVDEGSLTEMETNMPKEIMQLREDMKTVDPRIEAWCAQQKATTAGWELDLENKGQLKSLLFECLNLPVLRFTKQGRKLLGEDVAAATENMRHALAAEKPELKADAAQLELAVQQQLREVAAVDKFTLNKICAEFAQLRPLQKYRKAFKLYSTYVRPMRNTFSTGLDKKVRKGDQHLCFDQCVHASFLMTGTRGGRLSCCLPLTTRVMTGRGCLELQDVKAGDQIQTSKGPGQITDFFRTGVKPVLRLTLKTGIEIDCSAEHRFFVNGEWKHAGSIKAGDWLYQCGVGGVGPAEPEADLAAGAASHADYVACTPPGVLNVITAFSLGRHVAGSCASDKGIPSEVWKTSAQVMLAFARGLVEGCGTRQGFKLLITCSKKLATDMQQLLHAVGVCSSVEVHDDNSGNQCYHVSIAEQSMHVGVDLFNLVIPRACAEQEHRNSRVVLSADRKIQGARLALADHPVAAWAMKANARSVQVMSVQNLPGVEMCDITVDKGEFLLNGIRTHNSNPNLQQLPRDGVVKQMLVSRFGERGCMYQGDLSQIELRLMAAASGDPTMVKAYFDDIDLHSLTASRIYGVPYEHFTKAYMKGLQDKGQDKDAKLLELNRSVAKMTNFLTGYGGGAFGLQSVLAMQGIYKTVEECKDIIDRFFASYPALKRLLQEYKRFIMDSHVAVSIFGRVRVFEEVRGDDEEAIAKALRAGCNHLIQSTASDMMLTALVCIEGLMRQANLESILVSTVHDSLVIDAVKEEVPTVHGIVTDVLNNFPDVFKGAFGDDYDTSWMLVPFAGDCEVGPDYLSLKKIPNKDIDWDKLLASAD